MSRKVQRVITSNKIRDQYKIRDQFRARRSAPASLGGRDPACPEEDAGAAADEGQERSVYLRALELIRSEFSEQTWRAFWGVCVEDRDPAAVAADLGATRNAVYLAKSRVLQRLR